MPPRKQSTARLLDNKPSARDYYEDSSEEEAGPMKRKRKVAAPTAYSIYTNPDKLDHTKPPDGNPCHPGHPCRVIVVGPPGVGKRCILYNYLENTPFEFDAITEVHASAKSGEHEMFEDAADYQLWQWDTTTSGAGETPHTLIGVPPIDRFQRLNDDGSRMQNLLVLDEPPCDWPAPLRRDVGTLMNFNSTHNNTSVFMMTQYFSELPKAIRRSATHFVFFESKNKNDVNFWGRSTGVPDLFKLMQMLCRDKYDSITVDKTGDGPRLRRNMYEVIEHGEVRNPLPKRICKPTKQKHEDINSDEESERAGIARNVG